VIASALPLINVTKALPPKKAIFIKQFVTFFYPAGFLKQIISSILKFLTEMDVTYPLPIFSAVVCLYYLSSLLLPLLGPLLG